MATCDQAGREAVLDYVRTHRDALEAAYAGAHDGEQEAVHGMRVTSRRLRFLAAYIGGAEGTCRQGNSADDPSLIHRLTSTCQLDPPYVVWNNRCTVVAVPRSGVER
jgi:hypothetical protein